MTDRERPRGQRGPESTTGQVVVSAERIRVRVGELAGQIVDCYQGRELVVLAVMTGALVFLADLIRRLPLMMRLTLVSAGSYPGLSTCSNGIPSIGEVSDSLAGRDVLIVDDILDSGLTLRAIIERVRKLAPRSVKTCVLLRKVRPGADQPPADFLGFDIPDEFVVGYGLDYDNLYRNLPDVRALERPGKEDSA